MPEIDCLVSSAVFVVDCTVRQPGIAYHTEERYQIMCETAIETKQILLPHQIHRDPIVADAGPNPSRVTQQQLRADSIT